MEFAVLVAGFAVATWWQLHRALGGTAASCLISFEWPIFAGIAVAAWWHLIHEDPEARAAAETEREKVRPADRRKPSGEFDGRHPRKASGRPATLIARDVIGSLKTVDDGGRCGWRRTHKAQVLRTQGDAAR